MVDSCQTLGHGRGQQNCSPMPIHAPSERGSRAAAGRDGREVQEHLAANAAERPPAKSALYQKLKRAQLLHLLDDIEAETDEQREVRLREELAEHLRAHAGSRPSWTSPLYIKLQKAGLLGLLQAASGPMKQGPVRSTSVVRGELVMCYLEEILASGMMFAHQTLSVRFLAGFVMLPSRS